MKFIEVEQKYQVDGHDELRKALKTKGAVKIGSEHQIDEYFNAPHRDFLAEPRVNEWLRLREQDTGASINYKLWQPRNAEIKTHCDEYESSIGDVEAFRKLLNALDFETLITVEKQREIWQYGDIEVALDTVKGLGYFVEFEYKGKAAGIAAANEFLDRTIKPFSFLLGERNHLGYPYILLEELINERHNVKK